GIILGIGILLILSSGCTGPDTDQYQGQNLQSDTSSAVSEESVSFPPPDKRIDVQIEKNPIDQSITITFMGGQEQHLVKEVRVFVTRSDGTTSEIGLKPNKLAEVSVPGTRGTDRVVVRAIFYDGTLYTIAEEDVKTKERMNRV
ncbi:MAG: hypothetical protein JXA44_10555, partial [Methanospirillaceae archaeon]|nr:hypothetical protein [Methanospirillaceae archaeon]